MRIDGDANQLYVSHKSPAGFVVREAHGGRSTIAFDYRIVAEKLDEDGRRLAAVPIEERLARAVEGALTPLERLEQKVGPAKFAAELAEFKRQQRQ